AGRYMQTAGYDMFKSHSVWGFFELAAGAHSVWPRVLACASAALVVVAAASIRPTPGRPPFSRQFSAWVIATVLVSPHLFTYDLTVLLLPLVLLARDARRSGEVNSASRFDKRILAALALVYAAPAVSVGLAAATGVQITVPLLGLLLLMVVRDAHGQDARGARQKAHGADCTTPLSATAPGT
ncbi:MAG: hypothetical protein KDA41_03145, partial [Planctomycetales bacterium]|nr:hypothetical protein [Planctomycetales bacterium]